MKIKRHSSGVKKKKKNRKYPFNIDVEILFLSCLELL